MKYPLILLIFLFSCAFSFAQSSRENNKPEFDRGATYGAESKKGKKKQVKHSISKDYDKKVEEFEKRMVANVKKNQKVAKKMEKPQYSDPSYFGHKKKPKKRPNGKKKFCKECGLKH